MTKKSKAFAPLGLLLFLVAGWELAVRTERVEAWLLPAPSAIYEAWTASVDRTLSHLGATVEIALSGLGCGLLVGLLLASLFHLSSLLRDLFQPLVVLSQNIPMIALAPLLVMWLGFGAAPKILVVAIACFFPIAVATMDGFRQTDRTLLTYMRLAGATRWQQFIKLEWPSALPSFFSGLKLAATYSVMGAVIAEWLGAKEGLGVMMQLASASFRTDRVFLAMFFIAGVSLLLYAIITLVERWVIRWQRPRMKGGVPR
ncbi:ABC transporter permease [Laceyella putida]|uniref:ABC transporter permease n=1 Tax=Laceyella putida TaxID=110101 RepID=A0ABW2RLC1_9BACL